jgi:primosomal replication protein N
MKNVVLVAAIAVALLLAASPALVAHHSFAAEYDSKKPVTLTGIVTKVEWMNPHVYFFIDVTDEKGNVINWALEMGPPAGLQKSGWTRNTMKVGDEVTVQGTLARDGGKQANARSVIMTSTGKRLGAASSEGVIP